MAAFISADNSYIRDEKERLFPYQYENGLHGTYILCEIIIITRGGRLMHILLLCMLDSVFLLSSENNIHVIIRAMQCKRSCTDGRATMQSTPNALLRTDRNTASRFSMSLQAASFLLPNNGDTRRHLINLQKSIP